MWGITAAYSGTTTVNINLPSSFFNSVTGGTATPTGPYSNTNVLAVDFAGDLQVINSSTTSFGLSPLTIVGSNPINKYTVILIGT